MSLYAKSADVKNLIDAVALKGKFSNVRINGLDGIFSQFAGSINELMIIDE